MNAERENAMEVARRAMGACRELKEQISTALATGAPAWEMRTLEQRYQESSAEFHRAYAAFKYLKESSDER